MVFFSPKGVFFPKFLIGKNDTKKVGDYDEMNWGNFKGVVGREEILQKWGEN